MFFFPGRFRRLLVGFAAIAVGAENSSSVCECTDMRKKPRQQRSQAMVQSLIEATGRVIVARGLELTTTNHIAEAAGVDIASLYQYFHNKEELIEAVVQSIVEDVIKLSNDYLSSIDMFNETPEQLLRSVLTLGLATARANPVIKEIAMSSQYLSRSASRSILEQHMQNMATVYFRRHFRSYPIEDLHTRLYVVSISAFATIARHLSEPQPLIRDEELVTALVNMIAPYFQMGAIAN